MSKELHDLLTEMVKLYQERQCFLAVHAERLCALLPAAPAAPAQTVKDSLTTAPAVDPCLALWQAMNEAQKYGQRTDDKLIVKFLREAGYVIAPAAPAEVSGHAEFALQALVAAGHISQATVDGALQIAKRVVPAPAAPAPHPDTKDAERLDWLSRAGDVGIYMLHDQPGDGDMVLDTDIGNGQGASLRAAIDAAIAASKGGAA